MAEAGPAGSTCCAAGLDEPLLWCFLGFALLPDALLRRPSCLCLDAASAVWERCCPDEDCLWLLLACAPSLLCLNLLDADTGLLWLARACGLACCLLAPASCAGCPELLGRLRVFAEPGVDTDAGAADGLLAGLLNARGVLLLEMPDSLKASDLAVLALRWELAESGRCDEPADCGRWPLTDTEWSEAVWTPVLPVSAPELCAALLVALAERDSGPSEADLLLGCVAPLWRGSRAGEV